VAADIDLSANAPWALDEIAAAARSTDRTARVHLKIDTGLSRGGATADEWAALVDHALGLQAEGVLDLVGIWSHLAWADDPRHPTTDRQAAAFEAALAVAHDRGARPSVRHLANSAAALTRPDLHYDLVRPGLAVYGLSPVPEVGPPADFGLRPAMTLRARLSLVKRVPAGSGVAYGHTYVTERDTTLGLVPLGYGDGIPRAAGNVGPLQVAGRRHVIAGRVSMDQVVVDLDDRPDVGQLAAGDPVVVFGAGCHGEPTAQDWAEAVDTICYEIVTRIGSRVPRTYVGGAS
jgi:alanine racemase